MERTFQSGGHVMAALLREVGPVVVDAQKGPATLLSTGESPGRHWSCLIPWATQRCQGNLKRALKLLGLPNCERTSFLLRSFYVSLNTFLFPVCAGILLIYHPIFKFVLHKSLFISIKLRTLYSRLYILFNSHSCPTEYWEYYPPFLKGK